MKKYLLVLIIALLFSLQAKISRIKPPASLYPVLIKGMWGYINGKGKIIIAPKYEYAFNFDKNGIALVYTGFDGASTYAFERSSTSPVFLRAYINSKGQEVNPNDYIVKDSEEKFKPYSEYINNKVGSKWGYKDDTGKIVFMLDIPDIYYTRGFSEGLAFVKAAGYAGFIDKYGKVVIPFKFHEAADFHEGLARVLIKDKWSYIDKTGKIIVEPRFGRESKDFLNGYAVVVLENKYGLIDKSGKFVLNPEYDLLSDYNDDALCVKGNGKFGFMDIHGNFFINPVYDNASTFINTDFRKRYER